MKTYVKVGHWYKTNKPFKGDLDLQKTIKETLIRFNIPVVDPCCPGPAVVHPVAAINATATITAAQLETQLITSTSAAAVTGTLPTATLIGAALGAVQGFVFDFTVDNSAGANIFTVAVGAGITTVTAVVTGSATLTVAAGAVGLFRLYFSSPTVAKIARIV